MRELARAVLLEGAYQGYLERRATAPGLLLQSRGPFTREEFLEEWLDLEREFQLDVLRAALKAVVKFQ